jgi:hypothetical protein
MNSLFASESPDPGLNRPTRKKSDKSHHRILNGYSTNYKHSAKYSTSILLKNPTNSSSAANLSGTLESNPFRKYSLRL